MTTKSLKGQVWCFTGNFETFSSENWKLKLKERDIKVVSKISPNVTLLMKGNSTKNSEKIQEAKTLNIPIMKETDVIEMLGDIDLPTSRLPQQLAGEHCVVVGNPYYGSKRDWVKELKEYGAEVSDTVTKNTNFVLRGNGAANSQVIKLATKYNIPVVKETQLFSKLTQGQLFCAYAMISEYDDYLMLDMSDKEKIKFGNGICDW